MHLTAARLRELRRAKGLSQGAVAQILGITRTAYNKYESGAIRPTRKLQELSALYGVSVDYILGQEDELTERLRAAGPHTGAQLQKYLGLSEHGKYIVDITLDAVYEKEQSPPAD